MHQSSLKKMQEFYDNYLVTKVHDNLNILDLGSMNINGTYRTILNSNKNKWKYIGVDMEAGNGVDIVLINAYKWEEIQSDSIDVLISGQVFEHIEYFWIIILEVFRVLKPGGICCIIAPGAGEVHKYPVDCWRFYPDGFSAIAKFAQLNVIKIETQWESLGYEDGSDQWKDSILIAQKPVFGFFTHIKSKIKCYLQHRIMILGVK